MSLPYHVHSCSKGCHRSVNIEGFFFQGQRKVKNIRIEPLSPVIFAVNSGPMEVALYQMVKQTDLFTQRLVIF